MTDRELLELAAKAANLGDCWFDEFHDDYVVYHQDIDCNCSWNPLEDDGDALRLAVNLNLAITVGHKETHVEGPSEPLAYAFEKHGTDASAATRRAIVRAAASIGEQMK